MNKRIRRKKRVREFAEYGFEIEAEWNFFIPNVAQVTEKYSITPATEKKIEDTWDAILDFIDAKGFCSGGGSNWETIGICVGGLLKQPSHKYNINMTEKDRQEIFEFVKSLPTLKNVKVSGWADMWYPERKHQYKG